MDKWEKVGVCLLFAICTFASALIPMGWDKQDISIDNFQFTIDVRHGNKDTIVVEYEDRSYICTEVDATGSKSIRYYAPIKKGTFALMD